MVKPLHHRRHVNLTNLIYIRTQAFFVVKFKYFCFNPVLFFSFYEVYQAFNDVFCIKSALY